MKRYNTIIPILLSFSLSVTSCVSRDIVNPSTITTYSLTQEDTSTSPIMDSLTEEYYNYFDNLTFSYNYQEKYLTHAYIDALVEENKKIDECTFSFDGDITSIADKIKDNSNSNSFFTSDNLTILNRVLKKLYLNSTSNKDEDFHKLSTIKIAYGNGDDVGEFKDSDVHYVAYFDEDTNTLYLDKEYIKLVSSDLVISSNYYLEYLLEHELDHVRQVLCDCNKDIENTKFSYGEYITFLLESSAESSIYNELNSNFKIDYTYSDERIKESEILLLGLFSNDSIDEYYRSIYDNDLTGLFEYLDLSEEEIYDFYNIIYAIDGTMCRNELPYEIFSDIENVTYGELKKEIGYAYKQNLFKMVIMRMLKYNSENNISIEDNLAMYYLIKSLIFQDCYYFEETDESFNKVYPEEIADMVSMDEEFLKYLASKYKKSIEEIKEMESIDGYIMSSCLIDYIKTGEVTYDSYSKKVLKLIDKFPTITNILNNYNDIYLNSYSSSTKDYTLK